MAKIDPFNRNEYEETQDFDVIPAGWYQAAIVETDLVDNASGNGSHIKLTIQLEGGTFDRRLVWDRLTYTHTNPKAEEIGRGTYSKICRICGLEESNDTDDVLGQPLMVKLVTREYERNKFTNDVKDYQACPTVVPQKAPQAPTGPPAAPGDPDLEAGDDIPF